MAEEQSTETWLFIPGYPEFQVSDRGRVWSGPRGRLLKQSKRKHGGHLIVTLEGRQWRVHQLVMRAFVGEPPEGMEVCHADGNPENNCLVNLRYDTHKANIADRRRHGTRMRGVDLRVATRLTEDDVRRIRRLREDGLTYQAIATKMGMTDRSHVGDIINGRIWAWVDDDKLTAQSRAKILPKK